MLKTTQDVNSLPETSVFINVGAYVQKLNANVNLMLANVKIAAQSEPFF